jgi:hypothetical protein
MALRRAGAGFARGALNKSPSLSVYKSKRETDGSERRFFYVEETGMDDHGFGPDLCIHHPLC